MHESLKLKKLRKAVSYYANGLELAKERLLIEEARQKEKEKDPEKLKTRELCIRAYELRQRGLKWKEVAALVGRSVHHTADMAWRGKRLLERRV